MRRLALLLCFTCVCSVALGQGDWRDDIGDGRLVTSTGRAFPLKHTDVQMQIAGPVARVTIRQTFENPFTRPMEAIYAFPLPDQAAVDEFVMEIGQRRVYGEIQERQTARRNYLAAKREGKTAALLVQRRPNVFQQGIANVLGRERVIVQISYVEQLPCEKGWRSIVFPTTIGPRFHPKSVSMDDRMNIPAGPGAYATRPGANISITATVVVQGRYRHASSGTVRISGRRRGTTWEQSLQVTLPERNENNEPTRIPWARARIRDLLLPQGVQIPLETQKTVTALALEVYYRYGRVFGGR